MLNRKQLTIVWCLLLPAAALQAQASAPAESSPTEKFYRLDFVVQEVEGGKVVNGRTYFVIASTESQAFLRTGNKVAVQTGGGGVNYMDIGVNVDCNRLREVGKDLSLLVSAEVSSVAPPTEGVTNAPPVVRQNRWNSRIIIPLRKPTVIFSSDDLNSKRKMQLELTATPIG
jgi:hypothetical protein